MLFSRRDFLLALLLSLSIHGLALGATNFGLLDKAPTPLPTKPLKVKFVRVIDEHSEKEELAKLAPKPVPKPLVEKKLVPKPEPKPEPRKKPAKVVKPRPKPEEQREVVQAAREESIKSKQQERVLDGEAEKTSLNYYRLVASILAKKKKYPKIARRRRKEGQGVIELTILRSGKLQHVELVKAVGYSSLDREMMSLAKRAAPFPAFPENLSKRSVTIRVPIRFELL